MGATGGPVPTIKALPLKTAATIALAVAILWAVPHVPGLARFGGWKPEAPMEWLRFPAPAVNSGAPPAKTPARTVSADEADRAPITPSADLPNAVGFGAPMRHFYDALARTERKEPDAVTRILHYGDSPVTADSITSDVRSLLQKRFGDAGHGFVLIAKPWTWYGHRGIDLSAQGWKIEAATMGRASDGFHGLGGVSFQGLAGAESRVRLPDEAHTDAEVQYLEQPGGGSFKLSAGDQVLGTISTDGPEKKPAFARFHLPPRSREVELRVTSGSVRAFGYDFEKPGPGVIYNSLGLNGGQVQAVLRYFEPKQWAAQLQHQRPDLVVVNYGTNESVYPLYIEKQYGGELRGVIARIRAALPETSILIMSPMDRGERDSSGEIVTVPILPRIIQIQRQTARDMGCAFFDTFEAMGGTGTMGRWYAAQPRLVSADFMHPFPAGAAKVGAIVETALVAGYESSKPRLESKSEAAASGK